MATKKKRAKRRRVYEHIKLSRKAYLTDVRGRLVAEVGLCIPMFVQESTGFWATIRMLFPVVEAVATVIYRTHGKERKPVRLLRELGVPFPNLAWEIYRHSLMHNDELVACRYRDRAVDWSVSFGGGHHSAPGAIHLDLETLYNDFVGFLGDQIDAPKAKVSRVWPKHKFAFGNGTSRVVREEMRAFGRVV